MELIMACLMLVSFYLLSRQAAVVSVSSKKVPKGQEKGVIVIDAGHGGEDPGMIGIKNLEEKGIPKGAYLCSYPTFRGIYHHLVRMLERSGQSIYLMLCTIVDSKGRPMKEGAMLEGLAKRLEESICTSIRNSDVVNHYSKGQYLVLLINTTREDCAVIQKRINYKFLTDRQRTGVRYYVNSVVYEKDL